MVSRIYQRLRTNSHGSKSEKDQRKIRKHQRIRASIKDNFRFLFLFFWLWTGLKTVNSSCVIMLCYYGEAHRNFPPLISAITTFPRRLPNVKNIILSQTWIDFESRQEIKGRYICNLYLHQISHVIHFRLRYPVIFVQCTSNCKF